MAWLAPARKATSWRLSRNCNFLKVSFAGCGTFGLYINEATRGINRFAKLFQFTIWNSSAISNLNNVVSFVDTNVCHNSLFKSKIFKNLTFDYLYSCIYLCVLDVLFSSIYLLNCFYLIDLLLVYNKWEGTHVMSSISYSNAMERRASSNSSFSFLAIFCKRGKMLLLASTFIS